MLRTLFLASLGLSSCSGTPGQHSATTDTKGATNRIGETSGAYGPESPDLQSGIQIELFDDWSELPAWDFEQQVIELSTGHWSEANRKSLSQHLDQDGQSSIRAAVLLGYGGPLAGQALLLHLETRQEQPAREADAAEIVAARALARFDDPTFFERLTLLAIGSQPHPDLEIRVECACVALQAGRREVIPFLLRVLHGGTPAQLEDPIDWSPKETLAWSKGRAAAALSATAGRHNRFQADGSWSHQMAEAAALAKALDN